MDYCFWQDFIVGNSYPYIFDTSCLFQVTGSYHQEMLGDVSSATSARGGRALDVYMLAEDLQGTLDQLPPSDRHRGSALHAHDVFYPVGVGVV